MATSFGALCTDFYVNHKLSLRMDLPDERETILHFLERVRKAIPSMNRFRRYDAELALESTRKEAEYRWLALRPTTIRTGHVNPQAMSNAYQFHRMIMELAPYHLSLSPLDIDFVELLFGFDLECKDNHDQVVFEALIEETPLARLLQVPEAKIMDVQPVFGVNLKDDGDLQAYFEVKTRRRNRHGSSKPYRNEPISLFVTVRKYGPVDRVEDLVTGFDQLAEHCETLATDQLVPNLLTPIARHITSSSP